MYQTLDFHVRGVAPLLMRNGQLANPRNNFAKEMKKITSKRKKTDEDYDALADLEFMGGLYVDENNRAVLPGELIEATLVSAAKKTKKGKDAKSAIIVDGVAPLIYNGPKTPEALRDDDRFRSCTGVVIGQNRVMRTRPCFKEWEAKFTVHYLDDIFNAEEITDFVQTAGRQIGFADGRPRYGRFEVVDSTS
jgi:hypothetical protein